MQTLTLTSFIWVLLSWSINSSLGEQVAPSNLDHPSSVALLEGSGEWMYRHFPSGLRLYVFDEDATGKSTCNRGCSGAWPPLRAPDDAESLGDWSAIMRDDKSKQWAYKRRPVYLRFHDSVDNPTGDGIDGVWHILEP